MFAPPDDDGGDYFDDMHADRATGRAGGGGGGFGNPNHNGGRGRGRSASLSGSGSMLTRLLDQFGSTSDDSQIDAAPSMSPPSDIVPDTRPPPPPKAERSRSVEHFMAPGAANNPGRARPGAADADPNAKPAIKYISAEDMARRNIVNKYGEKALQNADIDLEHTSCEELEREQIERQVRRDTAKRRRMTCSQRTGRRNRRLCRHAADERHGSIHSASLEHVDRDFLRRQVGLDGGDDDDDDDDSDSDYRRKDFYEQPLGRSEASTSPPERRLTRTRKRALAPSVATAVGRVTRCFLCGWGRDEYTMVDNDHIKELFRILYGQPGTDMKIIALEAHKFYMTQIYRDAVLRHQELPVWRSQAIHICLTQHKKEPKIKLQIHLSQIDQKLETLNSMCFFESGDGVVHPHHKNMREYRDLLQLYWKLMEKDMTKMNFHQPELNIRFAESEYRAHSVRIRQHRATVNKLLQ